MRRTSIFKVFIFLLVTITIFLVSLLFAVPKSVLLDKLLSQRNVHLFADRVEEGALGFSLEGVRVLYGSMSVFRFDRLSLGLYPVGVKMLGTCEGGSLLARMSGSLSLEIKNFTCSGLVKRAEGRLVISEGVRGRLRLEGLSLRGVSVDAIELEFTGESFKGVIDYAGMTLTGGGRIKLKKELANSSLDASFRGNLGTLTLKGTLKNISVQLR